MKLTIFPALALLLALSFHSADAALGKDAGMSIVLNPNITQFITNNYTTNNYTYYGGFDPAAPWLYNDTSSIYFNYSRLIFEFYNSSQVNAKLALQDECSEISGCVVGAITSSYNATYAATSADVTANRTDWLTRCYNATYENTYNATYALTSADVTANRTAWLTNCYNASYEGTYNASYESTYNITYHNYWQLNQSNSTLYWAGLLSPLSAWTDTFNQSYHNFWLSNRSATSNSSSYWDDLDAPLSSWTDTYNASYHPTWQDVIANRSAWFSTYNATYAAKQDDIGASCGEGNYTYGVQDDGTLLCREDVIGGEGSSYNATYHVVWLDVQENRTLWETDTNTNCSADGSCSLITYDSETAAWDKNAADDFDGAWSSLSGVPAGFADGVDNDTKYSHLSNFSDDIGVSSDWDECSDASACGWLTSYTETDPLWQSNWTGYNKGNWDSAFSYVTNSTFQQGTELWNTTAEIFAVCNNGTFQKEIGSDCDMDNYVYGVQDDGTLLCRADQVGGGGAAGDKWVDGGAFIYPNSTFADNVVVYGYVKAHDWTNVSITEAQVSDFGSYLESESDPLWTANFSTYNNADWDSAFSYCTNGTFLESYDETDPLWTANFTNGYNKTAWDTAYSWEDHSLAGYWSSCDDSDACEYLTSYTETDPLWQGNWSGYNKGDWDASFSYVTNGTFLQSYTETDPRWSGNYTACAANQKLYFDGRSLACNNDVDTNTYNTTQEMFNACNNGSFIATLNSSVLNWNRAYSYTTNGTFINYLNASIGNWDKAFSYSTNGTFAPISEPRWFGNMTAALNQTATDVACGTSCVSDAEVDNDITVASSKNITTTEFIVMPVDKKICFGNCTIYIMFSSATGNLTISNQGG